MNNLKRMYLIAKKKVAKQVNSYYGGMMENSILKGDINYYDFLRCCSGKKLRSLELQLRGIQK